MSDLFRNEAIDGAAPHGVYCVCLRDDRRPTLLQVEEALTGAGGRLRLTHLDADDDGRFLSAVVEAAQDAATLRFTYHAGPEVAERSRELAAWMVDTLDRSSLKTLAGCDGRLDVEHFERLSNDDLRGLASWGPADDDFELDPAEPFGGPLDPASLLATVTALVRLTGGVALDPLAGEPLL
jgi:hypothetical protein